MKHFLTSLFLLATLAAPSVMAQNQLNTPDAKVIAATPRDTYRSLLARFESGQKLDAADMMTVYYGAVSQPGFNPDVSYSALDAAYNTGDMAKAHNLAAEALRKDPTNLYLLFKAYASAAASTDHTIKSLAPKYQTRLLGIVRGLLFRHFGGGIRAFGLRGDLLGRLANLFGIRGSNVSHIIGIADRLRGSRRVRIFSSHRFSF